MQELVELCYGKNANLYSDVLQVPHGATEQDIQSAFVSRRYELFNDLQNASMSNAPNRILTSSTGAIVSLTERQFTEKKMDALISVYRLLCNTEKRREYNLSLSAKKIQERRMNMKSNSNNTMNTHAGSAKASPVSVDELKEGGSEGSSDSVGASVDAGGKPGRGAGGSIHESITEELDAILIDDSRDQTGSPSLHLATSGPGHVPTPTFPKRGFKLSINPKKKLFATPNRSHRSPSVRGRFNRSPKKNANAAKNNVSTTPSLDDQDPNSKSEEWGRDKVSSGSFVIDEATSAESEELSLSIKASSSNSRVSRIPINSNGGMYSSSEFLSISTSGSSDTHASTQYKTTRKGVSISHDSPYSTDREGSSIPSPFESSKSSENENSISYLSPKPSTKSSKKNISPSSADSNSVTWSESVEQDQAKAKKKKKKKKKRYRNGKENDMKDDYKPGLLASWLRSYNYDDEADFVDDIGREINGAASDTCLAFSQVWNAFSIEGDAIDSMALDINAATSDLAQGEYTR